MFQDTIEEARRIAMDLRPPILDDLGILATTNWFCREFRKTYSSINIEKTIEMEENDVPEFQKIVMFRVLQEALNNVAKHSKADLVLVRLRKKEGRTELTIRDNGAGFDPQSSNSTQYQDGGSGLAGMKERTTLSGGRFSVDTSDAGTVIEASWPAQTSTPTCR
jgi:signal transduction histidine kinase